MRKCGLYNDKPLKLEYFDIKNSRFGALEYQIRLGMAKEGRSGALDVEEEEKDLGLS